MLCFLNSYAERVYSSDCKHPRVSTVVVGIPESLLVRIFFLFCSWRWCWSSVQLLSSLSLEVRYDLLLASLCLESFNELGNELHLLMTSSSGASSSKLLESAIRCHDWVVVRAVLVVCGLLLSLIVRSSLERYPGSLLSPSQFCVQHPRCVRQRQTFLYGIGGMHPGVLHFEYRGLSAFLRCRRYTESCTPLWLAVDGEFPACWMSFWCYTFRQSFWCLHLVQRCMG